MLKQARGRTATTSAAELAEPDRSLSPKAIERSEIVEGETRCHDYANRREFASLGVTSAPTTSKKKKRKEKSSSGVGFESKTNIESRVASFDEDYCHCRGGEYLQRNFSASQRATSEQELCVNEPAPSSRGIVAAAAAAAAGDCKSEISTSNNKIKPRLNKQRMRNIITPVKYEPSDETTEDSLEYNNDRQQSDVVQHHIAGASRNNGAVQTLHHVAAKGVPVLPTTTSLRRKLTATNWQPATDGRQYEHKVSSRASSRNDYEPSFKLEPRAYNQQDEEQQAEPLSCRLPVSLAGPPIVKHQASSSRRLLNQLARLRRLSEPSYRVKRPEKVAKVESLIEQLEKATFEWEEDELLLDRAERRDWPAKYQHTYPTNSRTVEELNDHLSEEEFGRRADVDSLEANAIARSHSIVNLTKMMGNAQQYKTSSSWSANSTLNRHSLARRRPRAFADRYYDDLAVRRLSRASLQSSPLSMHNEPMPESGHQVQMSYLLCSNAYTPTIDSNTNSPYDTLERRIRSDDLHYRHVRPKPEPSEPPFGIPKQETLANNYSSSATHYLGQHKSSSCNLPVNQFTCACGCVLHQQQNTYYPTSQQKRSDSKVSFVDATGGRLSADSGLVESSPLSGGRQSAASRLTLNSPCGGSDKYVEGNNANQRRTLEQANKYNSSAPRVDFDDEDIDDAAVEVDIEEELIDSRASSKLDADRWSNCVSPTIERYKAKLRTTPIRLRPKINIENPRSKSPLLRPLKQLETPVRQKCHQDSSSQKVQIQCYTDTLKGTSNGERQTSELECRYDFQDEDDEELETEIRKYVTTDLDADEASANDSSLERLNYRAKSTATLDQIKKSTKDGPSFSIGEYKPLNKPNLKIL